MKRPRLALAALVLIAGGLWVQQSFSADLLRETDRVERGSQVIATRFGQLEYAAVGSGPSFLMLHGTGGGFDQGLAFTETLPPRGIQVIAPSRFGYLRSDMPAGATPADQADALVELLDRLGIDRIVVGGGSAGAIPAVQFALRHPQRCAGLILIVPAAWRPGAVRQDNADAVERMTRVLFNDFISWSASKLARRSMTGTLLATDPELIDRLAPEERQRAHRILVEMLPVSRRAEGFRHDARYSGQPEPVDYRAVHVPALLISAVDDRFGTADTARYMHSQMQDSRLILYPDGGHILAGRQDEAGEAMAAFIHAHR
jgi:2-hydroxy-6-oxonona-2,4-dienedioate hydrolase